MRLLKFITPFIWMFPVCLVLAFMTWAGKFIDISLRPQQAILFVALAFTMLIIDIFMKYLLGKEKILAVWLLELTAIIILLVIIIPKMDQVHYV